MERRHRCIFTRKNRQLAGVFVEVFGEVAQADTKRGNVVDQGGGKEAPVGNLNSRVRELNPGILAFVHLGKLPLAAGRHAQTGDQGGSVSPCKVCAVSQPLAHTLPAGTVV